MNFIPAGIVLTDNVMDAQTDVGTVELPEDVVTAVENWGGPYDELTLGIRPEDINDAELSEDQGSSNGSVNIFVHLVEPVGSDRFLTLRPDSDSHERMEFTTRVDPDSDITQDRT